MESMTSGRIIARFLLCLCLTGCARLPIHPEVTVDGSNIELMQWQCVGRVGVKQNGRGGSAHFNWSQSAAKYQIDFTGPIGVGHARIVGDGSEVNLYIDNKIQGTAESADELTTQFLGSQLPVSGLVFWIRGIPDPEKQWRQLSDFEFIQQGWHIEIVDTQIVASYALPRKLRLHRDDLKLTLVLTQWMI